MKRPGAASAAPASAESDGAGEPSAARALRAQALPLVALMARLRDAAPADPAALRRSLAAAVNRFEADARVAGVDEASIAAASYVLCAWGDEQFDAAPWGAGGAGLLQHFHGEADGGDKLLRLLARLAEKPREHRALLELFHTCLSLGLRARIDQGNRDHETLRSRVHLALQQVAPVPALMAPWHCARGGRQPAAGATRRVAGGPAARRAGLGRLQCQPAAACGARRRRAGVVAATRAGTHRHGGARGGHGRRRRRGWPPTLRDDIDCRPLVGPRRGAAQRGRGRRRRAAATPPAH